MDAAAAKFLLEPLMGVLEEHAHRLVEMGADIVDLTMELRLLQAKLIDDSANIRRKDETWQAVYREIRKAVYVIEDAIDEFLIVTLQDPKINRRKSFISRIFTKVPAPAQLPNVAEVVEAIKKVVKCVRLLIEMKVDWELEPKQFEEMIKIPTVSKDKCTVGFEREQERIINWLWKDTGKLDVIPIVGMPGIGKTTLAYKIFTAPIGMIKGECRIWVNVSHAYRKKDVLLSILSHFTEVTDISRHKSDQEISKLVWRQLQKLNRFLIVMDDVWSEEVWADISQGIFSEPLKGGKILITTQLEEVAGSFNITEDPVRLRPLRSEERQFFQNANTSFYDKLPYHLRPCFLYMGIFPKRFEIPVKRLTRLWMAEGFIHKMAGMSPEQTAFQYLMELINRNLVMIGKTGLDGHIKTCRVDLMLWDFCRKEASSERGNYLFQEMGYGRQHTFESSPSNLEMYRRLCINYNVISDFSSYSAVCPKVRSFLILSSHDEDEFLCHFDVNSHFRLLKYVRVLEAESLIFRVLPNDLTRLVLLRYLVLSIDSKVIPETFSRLKNMQTLIIYNKYSSPLEMKADIWEMSQLRHVETNVATMLPQPKDGKEGKMQLQTLGMILLWSCTEQVFGQLRGLRKLGIHMGFGKYAMHEGLGTLYELEELKLVNQSYRYCKFFLSEFPPNLRSLTLRHTMLDQQQMSMLGGLNKLEVLKLKENAFRGEVWEATDDGFRGLQVLHIEKNKLLNEWVASPDSFPVLRCLKVSNCKCLQEIPFSLRKSLQNLDLDGVQDSVVESAWKIKLARKEDLSLNIGHEYFESKSSSYDN